MSRNEVFLMRHAESVGNRTGGKDTSDHGELSYRGKRQATSIVEPLESLAIDQVVVSPFKRARRTVLPYLRATDTTGEVWPELAEGCWHTEHDDRRIETIRDGEPIVLTEDERSHMTVVTDEYPAQYPPDDESYAEGLTRIRLAHKRVERLMTARQAHSLLIVAHGHLNPRLIELLLDMEPYGRMDHENIGLTRVWEPPEGKHDRRLSFCNRQVTDV